MLVCFNFFLFCIAIQKLYVALSMPPPHFVVICYLHIMHIPNNTSRLDSQSAKRLFWANELRWWSLDAFSLFLFYFILPTVTTIRRNQDHFGSRKTYEWVCLSSTKLYNFVLSADTDTHTLFIYPTFQLDKFKETTMSVGRSESEYTHTYNCFILSRHKIGEGSAIAQ